MPEHINKSFPEEKRPMMYKMMKWWGGKPQNIWSEYIKCYTEEGDVVLDPFCGRGVGVIEAVRNRRNAIGVDLNPIAIFQTRMISTELNLEQFKKEWSKLKVELEKSEKECGFFVTQCLLCKKSARLVTTNREKAPYSVVFLCPCTKRYQEKRPDIDDIILITKSDKHTIPFQYPKNDFPDTYSFKTARKNYGKTYDGLFTKRNIFALSLIFDRVNKIEDTNLRDFFKFAFISMVHLASKIPSVRENSDRRGSGSWGRPAYIKMRKSMELNPFLLYQRAIESSQGIIKGKTSSNERLENKIKLAETVDDFDSSCNLLLLQKNTTELNKFLKENSVDYIITDPPYGGLIPYFDLSFMWSAWLSLTDKSFTIPFDAEITIDEYRKIDLVEYQKRMGMAFENIYKVLKENKYMTVTFHNDKPRVFNSILYVCQNSGFVLENILFQRNKRSGEKKTSNHWGTSVSDFYIRFRKPGKNEKIVLTDYVETKFEDIVESAAKKVLKEYGAVEIAVMIPQIYKDMGNLKICFSSDDQIHSILKKNKDFVNKDGLWQLSPE